MEISTEESGEVLIYAISHTPVRRLSPDFKDDLMKADIPIGKIIRQHNIEARREILTARVLPATEEAWEGILHLQERTAPLPPVPDHPRRQTAHLHRGAVPLQPVPRPAGGLS